MTAGRAAAPPNPRHPVSPLLRGGPGPAGAPAPAFQVWKTALMSALIFGGWQIAYHLMFMGGMPLKGMLEIHLTDLLVETCGAMLVTVYFIRAMRRQNARLKAVDRQKRMLTDAIVNSLREPLSGMRLSLSCMKAGGAPEDRISAAMTRMVDITMDSSAAIIETVNDLLDVVWLEEARPVLKLEPVAALDFIECGIRAAAPLARQRGIKIRRRLPADIPVVMGDAKRLGRVLAHLLGNAVRHSRTGGDVRVDAARDAASGLLTVSVSDSGPGIPAGLKDRLFEWSPHAAGGRREELSTGIGLHFCRLVIEGHGGEILLKGGRPKGAVFAFSIPG